MLQWKCSPISARGGGNGGDCLEDYLLLFLLRAFEILLNIVASHSCTENHYSALNEAKVLTKRIFFK